MVKDSKAPWNHKFVNTQHDRPRPNKQNNCQILRYIPEYQFKLVPFTLSPGIPNVSVSSDSNFYVHEYISYFQKNYMVINK